MRPFCLIWLKNSGDFIVTFEINIRVRYYSFYIFSNIHLKRIAIGKDGTPSTYILRSVSYIWTSLSILFKTEYVKWGQLFFMMKYWLCFSFYLRTFPIPSLLFKLSGDNKVLIVDIWRYKLLFYNWPTLIWTIYFWIK